jgi:hypothetical protein
MHTDILCRLQPAIAVLLRCWVVLACVGWCSTAPSAYAVTNCINGVSNACNDVKNSGDLAPYTVTLPANAYNVEGHRTIQICRSDGCATVTHNQKDYIRGTNVCGYYDGSTGRMCAYISEPIGCVQMQWSQAS